LTVQKADYPGFPVVGLANGAAGQIGFRIGGGGFGSTLPDANRPDPETDKIEAGFFTQEKYNPF
jgi:hypothetical protein